MERKSGFEAYRILCILLIVLMHTFGSGAGQLNTALGIFIVVIGNIGVTGFMLLSGYFGIRLKIKKLIKLDIMMIFWSLCYEAVLFFTSGGGYHPGKKELLGAVLPFASRRYWFLSAYFCICILSPFINEYLEGLSREKFKRLIMSMSVIFLVIPTVIGFEQTGDGGKGIINLMLAYVIGRYIGIYHRDTAINVTKWTGALFGVIAVNFGLNAGMYFIFGSNANYFARDNSALTMIQAVILLMLFKELKIKSRMVNLCAANVVAVYVTEDTIKNLIRAALPGIMDNNGAGHYVLIVMAVTAVTFVAAVIAEGLRKMIFGKAEDYIINLCGSRVKKWKKQ